MVEDIGIQSRSLDPLALSAHDRTSVDNLGGHNSDSFNESKGLYKGHIGNFINYLRGQNAANIDEYVHYKALYALETSLKEP